MCRSLISFTSFVLTTSSRSRARFPECPARTSFRTRAFSFPARPARAPLRPCRRALRGLPLRRRDRPGRPGPARRVRPAPRAPAGPPPGSARSPAQPLLLLVPGSDLPRPAGPPFPSPGEGLHDLVFAEGQGQGPGRTSALPEFSKARSMPSRTASSGTRAFSQRAMRAMSFGERKNGAPRRGRTPGRSSGSRSPYSSLFLS